MGKNKAHSADGLMDVIFQKESRRNILPNVPMKLKTDCLVERITDYLNEVIGKNEWPYDQSLLEQIFIPKGGDNYHNFDNARPITKTSPLYKLLDTILSNRL